MNTILLFFCSYDLFSGKVQSAHFFLFRNVRLCRSNSTVQIYFIKSSVNSVPWHFNALALLEIAVVVANLSFFDSLPIHLSSFAVVFLGLPRGFLASHDRVISSFRKMLWITVLDYPTVFEISPIESLSSLRNLIISFLSSKDVIFFLPYLQYKSRCNSVKYPTLYSSPKFFLNNAK